MTNPPLIGDFDGDGKPDLYQQALLPPDAHKFIPGDGSKAVVSRIESASDIAQSHARPLVGDFNGDGKDDVIYQTLSSVMPVLLSPLIPGSAVSKQDPSTLKKLTEERAWVGNFDGVVGDEVLAQPLVAGQPTRLLAGNSSGGFLSVRSSWAEFAPETSSHGQYRVWNGDFNRDGRSDVVWLNTLTGSSGVVLLDDSGRAQQSDLATIAVSKAPGAAQASAEWQVVATPDLDGDGSSDVLWRQRDSGALWHYLMQGAGIKSQGSLVAVADLNYQVRDWLTLQDASGVKQSAIVWQHKVSLRQELWFIDKTTGLASASGYVDTIRDARWQPSSRIRWADGRDWLPENLSPQLLTGRVTYWFKQHNTKKEWTAQRAQGASLKLGQAAYSAGFWTETLLGVEYDASRYQLLAGDVDADGWRDLVVQPRYSGATSLTLLKGNGGLGVASSIQVPAWSGADLNSGQYGALLSDMNGDGKADLYLQKLGDSQAATLNGTTSGLALSGTASAWPTRSGNQVSANVVPGKTVGEFRVTEQGAASYQLAIATAPGTAGVVPKLGLSYSSQVGNGIAGVGWSLDGMSSIGRCPKNRVQDGAYAPLTYSNTDPYCLDGQRLVLFKGTHGSDNAEYRTELDSGQQIIARHLSAGAQPACFVVKTLAGETKTYGDCSVAPDYASNQAPYARLMNSDRLAVLSWSLNRVEDSLGNYFAYRYQSTWEVTAQAQTDFQLSEVVYTGNSKAKLAPYNSLKLVYETRPALEYQSGYALGQPIKSTQRLKTIESYSSGAVLRRYNLIYGWDATTSSSTLDTIQECAGNGQCLLPIQFSYERKATDWQSGKALFGGLYQVADWWASNELNASSTLVLDANGDGKTDLVTIQADDEHQIGNLVISYSNGANFNTRKFTTFYTHRGQIIPLDYDQDGKVELLFADVNDSYKWKWLDLETGLVKSESNQSGLISNPRVGDINADGFADVIVGSYANSQWDGYLRKCTGSSSGWFTCDLITLNPGDIDALGVVDVFGNGKSELLSTRRHLDRVAYDDSQYDIDTGNSVEINYGDEYLSLGSNLEIKYAKYSYQKSYLGKDPINSRILVDLNGDGITDIVSREKSEWATYAWNVEFGTQAKNGAPFLPMQTVKFITGVPVTTRFDAVKIMDFTGDGRPDLLAAGGGENPPGFWTLHVQLANGSFEATPAAWMPDSIGWNSIQFVDMDGDGQMELLSFRNQNWHARKFVTEGRGLLVKVQEGKDDPLEIGYKPMTDSSVYKSFTATDRALPAGQIEAPLSAQPLVSAVTSKGQSVQYEYAGLRYEPKGRGSLGFARLTTRQTKTTLKPDGSSQTGQFSTTTSYSQTFPYLGMPLKTDRTLNGKLLSWSTNDYAMEGAVYPQGQAKVLYPYLKTSTEASYEFNDDQGTTKASKIVRTSYRYAPMADAGYLRLDEVKAESLTPAWVAVGTTLTENQYAQDNLTAWRLGRLTQAKVTKTIADNSLMSGAKFSAANPGWLSSSRTSGFAYDTATGLLTRETLDVGTAQAMSSCYLHDTFGNRIESQQIAGAQCGLSGGRRVKTQFDAQGRFAIQSTGLQGEVASSQYDPTLGVVLSQTDANGLTVRYGYDAFGRQVWQRSPTGNLAQTARAFADATQTDIEVTQTATGAPTQTERVNAQGLKLWSRTQGFDGRTIQVDYGYDANLRLIKQSAPYFHGTLAASIGYTQSYYDLLDRSIQVSVVDPSKGISLAPETITYRPNLQIQRKQGREHWTYVNELGQITSVETRTHATEQVCQEYAADTATGEPTCKQFAPKASLSGWVDYRYDAAGNQIRVYSPNTETAAVASQGARVSRAAGDYNEIVLEYDLQGRKTRLQDPDKGGVLGKAWTYSYSAYGELIKQVDAKGQTTELEYDTYGQLVRRLRSHATDAAVEIQTACWSYGASRGQFGQTLSVRQYGKKVACDTTEAPDYAEHFRYDSLGRPQTTETEALIYQAQRDAQGKVIKNAQGQEQYAATRERFYSGQAYNSLGQLVRQDYPNGFSVNRVYSSQGYLSELRDSDTNQSYLTVTAMNARGAVTGHRLGNGVEVSQVFNEATGLQTGSLAGASGNLFNEAYGYDGRGNLSSRADTVQGRREAMNYDAHNRLVLSTSSKNSAPELSLRYAYDTQGNMLQRGSTRYAACKTFSTVNNVKVCTQWVGTNQNLTSYYRYKANVGESLAGPHAVRGLSGDETASFNYDANGNQLQGTTANTYNLADQLVKAVKGTTQVEFAYAPDGDRYLRVDTVQGKRQLTFSQGGYERVDDELNRTHKYSVGGVVLITEQETWTNPNSYVRDLTYLVKDYLGSVRLELDSQGKERSRMRYSAFGEQYSDPLNGLITSGARIELNRLQNRGYTGHEEIAALGLIHMNGRVYDPKLGRFLQADPFVQDATSLQALNRYSYVENNPFAATDPSGFFLISKVWKGIIKAVVKVLGPQLTNFIGTMVGSFFGPAGVAVWSYMYSRAMGASVSQALVGAAQSFLFATATTAVGQTYGEPGFLSSTHLIKIGVHGFLGGFAAGMQGGRFRDGFVAAGVGEFAAPGINGVMKKSTGAGSPGYVARVSIAAIAGGTASYLTGGKFANGAMTAAMGRMFNGETQMGGDSQGADEGRPLTANEIIEAKKVYGDKIDYSKVRVFGHKYVLTQENSAAMAPDGNIYFPLASGCSDMTKCVVYVPGSDGGAVYGILGTFIHEMAHVMQYQSGVDVKSIGASLQTKKILSFGLYNPGKYNYGDNPDKLNIEAQAQYYRNQYCSLTNRCTVRDYD